jgi:hypothetical protein
MRHRGRRSGRPVPPRPGFPTAHALRSSTCWTNRVALRPGACRRSGPAARASAARAEPPCTGGGEAVWPRARPASAPASRPVRATRYRAARPSPGRLWERPRLPRLEMDIVLGPGDIRTPHRMPHRMPRRLPRRLPHTPRRSPARRCSLAAEGGAHHRTHFSGAAFSARPSGA